MLGQSNLSRDLKEGVFDARVLVADHRVLLEQSDILPAVALIDASATLRRLDVVVSRTSEKHAFVPRVIAHFADFSMICTGCRFAATERCPDLSERVVLGRACTL